MKKILILILAAIGLAGQTTGDGPQFTPDGQLTLPKDYRQWVFLSSGLGMTYDPNPADSANPNFNNVFVNPTAYRSFTATGHWPDHTMFILEIRTSASHGSINNGGHYQTQIRAIEAEVKDEKRFPQKWAFFPFGAKEQATALPATSDCNNCHAQNGAVDNTFVQFYPTLLDIATAKGTLRTAAK
jgi:hypothetical protein